VPVGRAEPVMHLLLERLDHVLRLREHTLVLSFDHPYGPRMRPKLFAFGREICYSDEVAQRRNWAGSEVGNCN